MNVTNIIKAIKSRCDVFNEHVYGAFEYVRLAERINPSSLPAAYVFTASESAETMQGTETDYYQLITARIAVVVICSSGDERGQDGADLLSTCQTSLFNGILGWSPLSDDNKAILSYEGCQAISRNPAIVAMQFTFLCTYQLGVDDTFIPTGLAEGSEITGVLPVGRLNTMDFGSDLEDDEHGIDMIDHTLEAPDGIIDARMIITDLNPDEDESS